MSKAIGKNFISSSIAKESHLQLSERDLDWSMVKRIQNGDVAAYDNLVKKYRNPLFSMIYNMTGNSEDASDITQEVFIKAFQSIKQFQGKSSFFTWLYRIGTNTSINFIKKSKRQRFVSYESIDETLVGSEILEFLTSKNRTEKRILITEIQEKLNDALQKLSPKHRIVVILHEVEGMNHKDIAEIVKTSEGTVRSRLHYAKKELQIYLKDYVQ